MRKLFTAFVAVVALSFAFASCNESKEAAEGAQIDSFLTKYDSLVVKAEAAKTVEQKQALMGEWEAMGKELAALDTLKFNEEQMKKLNELNERANKAEMVVALPENANCEQKEEATEQTEETPAEEAPATEEAPAEAEQ